MIDKEKKRMETALKVISTWASFYMENPNYEDYKKVLKDIHNAAAKALGRDDLVKGVQAG